MTIQELQKEKILSRKTDAARSAALGVLLDSAKKIAKAENRDAVESDIVTAAKRNIKALTKTIDEIGTGELVDRYKSEIAVYEEFLPQMVDEATLEHKIKNKVVVSVDAVHRAMDREIDEIWIPELEACFNQEGFAFDCYAPRGDGREIEIEEIEFNLIKNLLEAQEASKLAVNSLFK
jgi:uncharacterized protein YqeY